jgi:hypothetical protein
MPAWVARKACLDSLSLRQVRLSFYQFDLASAGCLREQMMKTKSFTGTVLSIAPAALIAAWLATLVWVRDEEPWFQAAHTLLFFTAIYGVGAAAQVRAERRLDEVELAATRFGARWGLVSGVAFMTLLTFLPPIHSLLAEIMGAFSRIDNRNMTGESRLFLLAIVTTFMAQETFRSIFSAAWKWSKR